MIHLSLSTNILNYFENNNTKLAHLAVFPFLVGRGGVGRNQYRRMHASVVYHWAKPTGAAVFLFDMNKMLEGVLGKKYQDGIYNFLK